MSETRVRLGRLVSVIGYLWLAYVLVGMPLLVNRMGLRSPMLIAAGSSVIPAIVMIFGGRMMRNAGRRSTRPSPTETRPPVRPAPPRPAPRPEITEPVPTDQDEMSLPPLVVPPRRSSQELIDEARKRWGRG